MMTVGEYATHRGITEQGVLKAIQTKRLEASVRKVDGRWQIDQQLADHEWAQRTEKRAVSAATPTGGYHEAKARREAALAELAEIELRKEKGELVSKLAVIKEQSKRNGAAKTKLLGIPSRYKQRFPDLTLEHMAELEALIRESLTDLSRGVEVTP